MTAFYHSNDPFFLQETNGKLAVLGSSHMFADQYIEKEENQRFLDVLMNFLTAHELQLNAIDADEPEVADYHQIPDVASIAADIKACLQEGDEVPRDITSLFNSSLYIMDTSNVTKAIG